MQILALLLILVLVILFLLLLAIFQIKMAGIKVNDFWSFIKANDTLDKLAAFSAHYEKLSPQQQIIFLQEAETIFSAFDKIPHALWEEEYQKYMQILSKYQSIKMARWHEVD